MKGRIRVIAAILSVMLPFAVVSQTSPGGVLTVTDCKLWIDAGDLNGDGNYTNNPAVNTAVSTWNDKSGNANNLTQATGTAQPTYTTVGGFPCTYFNNTGTNANYMNAATQSMLTPGTMYFVLYMVDAGDGANCLFDRNVSGNTSVRFTQWNGTGELGFTKYGTSDYASTMNATFTTNVIVSFLKTSGSNNLVVAQNNASVSLAIGSSNPGLPLYVLGKNNTSDGMNGYIMEALAYDIDLNPAQKNIVDNYLSAKYGNIPIIANKYAGATAVNGNYDYELGGIGTESAGSNNTAASSITGGLAAAQSVAMENGEYLMYAHQTGSNGLDYFDVGGMSAGLNKARWKRIWYFTWTHVGGTTESVNLTFDFSDAGSAGGTAATPLTNYKLLYRAGLSGNWTEVMSASNIIGDRVTFNAVPYTQGNGYYTIGTLNNAISPLPIELTSFGAEACNYEVCLSWSCAMEKNTDHFIVERSADGESWKTIATAPAAGNSSSETHYTVTDPKPLNGLAYYRLTTVDKDQSLSHSSLRTIQMSLHPQITVFPNPSTGLFTMVSAYHDARALGLELMNMAGNKIMIHPVLIDDATIQLDLSELESGIYLLSTTSAGGYTVTNKLIIH